jgi:DNA-binding CsgD family transcriptional regulator
VGAMRATRNVLGPPHGLEVRTFRRGSDEFAVFSFPLAPPDAHARNAAAGLTDAERDVVSLILREESIAAVARERRSSPRTIANQLSSIYRKLGVRSRRELRARVARPPADS